MKARAASLLIVLAACTSSADPPPTTPSPNPSSASATPRAPVELTMTSPAFEDGGAIPARFTCDGDDVSPPLRWERGPEGTVEWALLVDDADAPDEPLTHWVVFGIPGAATRLEPGTLPRGTKQGRNGFGDARWRGPCPPEGDEPHRYFFSLLALGRATELPEGAADADVRRVIQPHVIGRAQVMGTFGR